MNSVLLHTNCTARRDTLHRITNHVVPIRLSPHYILRRAASFAEQALTTRMPKVTRVGIPRRGHGHSTHSIADNNQHIMKHVLSALVSYTPIIGQCMTRSPSPPPITFCSMLHM